MRYLFSTLKTKNPLRHFEIVCNTSSKINLVIQHRSFEIPLALIHTKAYMLPCCFVHLAVMTLIAKTCLKLTQSNRRNRTGGKDYLDSFDLKTRKNSLTLRTTNISSIKSFKICLLG